MSKIKVLGVAEREVECDVMRIRLTFECVGKNQKDTISQVMKECESFLEFIKGQKIDIRLYDDSVKEVSLKENVKGYKTEKTLVIKGKYDGTLINVIHEICLRKGFTVSMDVDMGISKEKEVVSRKELLEEALRNSREEAELIMKTEGKTKLELSSVDRNDRYQRFAKDCGASDIFGGIFGNLFGNEYEETLAAVKSNFSNSNELMGKTEKVREEIEVVWKISE